MPPAARTRRSVSAGRTRRRARSTRYGLRAGGVRALVLPDAAGEQLQVEALLADAQVEVDDGQHGRGERKGDQRREGVGDRGEDRRDVASLADEPTSAAVMDPR